MMKMKSIASTVDEQPPHLRRCDELKARVQTEEGDSEIDLLCANKFGKKHLIRGNDEYVDVKSLKGKIIGLLFLTEGYIARGCSLDYLIDYYPKFDSSSFEIVYVSVPPPNHRDHDHDQMDDNDKNHSFTFPWLSIPFSDEDWRGHLSCLYLQSNVEFLGRLTIIDHTGHVLNPCALDCISRYGPQSYPFTIYRQQQLATHFDDLRTKHSDIKHLFASVSNGGYLIDRHFNKVPVSQLEGKDVAIYACTRKSVDSPIFFNQLVEIYHQFKPQGFEIVFVNLQYEGGYKDETSFNDALREMPWLVLPFGDDNYWALRYILTTGPFLRDDEWCNYPTLFIRALGQASLDPYGYHVIKKYGIQAYPFTRRAALKSERIRLRQLTFDSFLKQARLLGIDFYSLVPNTKEGEKDQVLSISTLNIMKRRRGVLLVFASSSNFTSDTLNSLVDSYSKQHELFPFEVIIIPLDKDPQFFLSHVSSMPWYAFHKQLEEQEYKDLMERTIKFNFYGNSHCVAFGHNGKFLRIGDLPRSFENLVFPYLKDVEFMNCLGLCMIRNDGWIWDADHAFGSEKHMDWLYD